jgi:S-adenosylmethionine uptake transporter
VNFKNYTIAVTWFICSIISSIVNDAITKYIALHFFQITFFRFIFGSGLLFFSIKFHTRKQLFFNNTYTHIFRGVLLFIASSLWTYGLTFSTLTSATVISFCIPIFILIFSVFFLKEHFTWYRCSSIIIGLFGIIVAFPIHSNSFKFQECILLVAAIIFALLDIINKKIVSRNTLIPMIFFSSVTVVILSFIPTIILWQNPSLKELFLLFVLGINSNLVLFFLLKAYMLCDISALIPYRYLELFLSAVIAYIIFQEVPTLNIFYGGAIIILSSMLIIYLEKKKLSKIPGI